ncbi:MAG TPA: hypothetical protein VJ831_14440 [Jatrophihabitantaceae bacterium]|nr:hypothetical protein [Jatrophihabitantaceae bacterium]
MSLSAKLRRAPVRAATGAYILSTGIDKIRAGDDTAKGLHSLASGAFPMFENVDPKLFTRVLGLTEIGLGTALLLPVVPPIAAGAGLAAFSGGLLGVYWRTPSLHRNAKDPRPTQDGIAFSKDSWMFGIGATLVLDAMLDNARQKRIELMHEVSKSAAVHTAQARTRRRMMRKLARARAAEMKANARAMTAGPAAKASAYLNTAKGMTRRMADVVT